MTSDNFKDKEFWYYAGKDGETIGPIPFSELKSLASNGLIAGDTFVCRLGEENWQPFRIVSLPPIPFALPPVPQPYGASRPKRVKEYRRTCQQCGKVWHSLMAREEKIQKDINENNCASVIHCCNPEVEAQNRRNIAANDSEISRLRKCPECQSANYNEQVIEHDTPPSK